MLACIRGSYLAGRVVGGGDWIHRHDCPDHETKHHQATGTVYEITNSRFVTGNNICGVMPGMAHCIGETNLPRPHLWRCGSCRRDVNTAV